MSIKEIGNPLDTSSAWAIFSDDKKYRYQLFRKFDEKNTGIVTWCMLNPSTADAFS